MKLTKGMFGHQFDSKSYFGIHTGQMRSPSLVHNGGWYNKEGEKLGWGDLHDKDFKHIAKDLEPDQLFIILSESDSFWNFVDHSNKFNFGFQAKTNPDESAPGVDYVAAHARYVITPDLFYKIDDHSSYNDGELYGLPVHLRMPITFTMLKRHRVKELMKA